MDDTGAVTPFDDIAFTFAYIDKFGPYYGLYLHKLKNQIILATNGIDPLPHIQPQLANDIRQVTHDFCQNKISLQGTILLGTPIFNSDLKTLYQAFLVHLCNLNPHDILPPHSWLLATRPLPAGELGILDPIINAHIHFICPLLGTITAAHEGI